MSSLQLLISVSFLMELSELLLHFSELVLVLFFHLSEPLLQLCQLKLVVFYLTVRLCPIATLNLKVGLVHFSLLKLSVLDTIII